MYNLDVGVRKTPTSCVKPVGWLEDCVGLILSKTHVTDRFGFRQEGEDFHVKVAKHIQSKDE